MTRHGRWLVASSMVLGAVAALTGCGLARPDAAAAGATAEAFYRAIATDDGGAACALLAPATAEALEDDADEPCGDAILAGRVGETLTARADDATGPTTRTAGRQAQTTLSTDVLFLTVSGDHWLVTAAACDARPHRPYDCELEGS